MVLILLYYTESNIPAVFIVIGIVVIVVVDSRSEWS